ncbi:hypothetical protein Glove_60g140 [Diversispora epigaea]|uniref:Uncharacterized protein n=1 Tax=Diversispora epigaea TaxID=1348612 RepID=A0A397JBP4_9GLOM|nr:hypothetical protein Glove_60g140 [Diversispora epigaea]
MIVLQPLQPLQTLQPYYSYKITSLFVITITRFMLKDDDDGDDDDDDDDGDDADNKNDENIPVIKSSCSSIIMLIQLRDLKPDFQAEFTKFHCDPKDQILRILSQILQIIILLPIYYLQIIRPKEFKVYTTTSTKIAIKQQQQQTWLLILGSSFAHFNEVALKKFDNFVNFNDVLNEMAIHLKTNSSAYKDYKDSIEFYGITQNSETYSLQYAKGGIFKN